MSEMVPLISDDGVTMVPVSEEDLAKLREFYERPENTRTFVIRNPAEPDVPRRHQPVLAEPECATCATAQDWDPDDV